MGEPDGSLVAGRVGRPHGLDGSFHVTGPRAALLEQGIPVTVGGAERRIERRAGTDERPILRLDGCVTREDAEALRGEELHVAAAHAPSLGPGEWWAEELEGCGVWDGQHEIGVVERLMELPSCECLVVARGEGGGELLVPLVRDAIRAVDVGAGRIDVDLAFLGEDG
jgi:16S rRNA processing protein RimM